VASIYLQVFQLLKKNLKFLMMMRRRNRKRRWSKQKRSRALPEEQPRQNSILRSLPKSK